MKAKTIAKTIQAKMEDWFSSIDDKTLVESLRRNIVLTGGSITSMFQQEPVNDYDVYVKKPSTAYRLAKYYAMKLNESNGNSFARLRLHMAGHTDHNKAFKNLQDFEGKERVQLFETREPLLEPDVLVSDYLLNDLERVEIFVKSEGVISAESETEEEKKKKYRPVFMSPNAITLSDKLQIVLRFTGEPEEIHKTYDFMHATNYWTFGEGLVTNVEALQCILARELVYRGSVYPLASIFRTRKFIQRGWSMHIGNYVKMALQLNELDLFDPAVLADQLTGVDAAYLYHVIDAVKAKRKEDPKFEFTSLYLCEIVDRLMGEESDKQSSET